MQTASYEMDTDLNRDAELAKLQQNSSYDSDQQQQQQLNPQQKLKHSMPTIYPNDYDFNVASGFRFNSTTSRSFVRPAKAISQEHRNISVPNSLKVHINITRVIILDVLSMFYDDTCIRFFMKLRRA